MSAATDTHRAATPEQTRARVEPVLGRFGITRVADLTGLDDIGIPVHVAYRPCGKTLAVSIGIGLEPAQAWVAAVMESIEVWHGENVTLPTLTQVSARELGVPYDVRTLTLAPYSPLTQDTKLDWVLGHGLLSGSEIAVPLGLVVLDSTARLNWDQVFFQPSSNGLATGNTSHEATLHALLEVIERDCCGPFLHTPPARRRPIAPDSCADVATRTVLAALHAAGCWVEVFETTNALEVPAFACSIWHPDLPVFFSGFGCDPDPGRALGRALLEATLSRLATISGARDDIDEAFYITAASADVRTPAASVGQVGCVPPPPPVPGSLDELIYHAAERVGAVTGVEPILLDLTRTDMGIAASKVVAPGLRTFDDRAMAARQE